MYRKPFLCVIIFVFLCGTSIFALNPVEKFINNPVMQNANVSLLVKNLKTGETLYELQPDNCRIPASTMKIITTSTALEMFGPDYRIETKLAIDGDISPTDSTLNGNLYIIGGGDPSLGSEKTGDKNFLSVWVNAIRKAGIKKINGHIIADESIFEKQVINPKWSWEDMGNYYAPAIHGISYLDNTFSIFLKSGKAGSATELVRVEPDIPHLVLDNYVKSASISSDNAYFYGAPNSLYRFVTGEIPVNRAEFRVKGDIPDPALLLATDLHKQLVATGCIIAQQPEVARENISVKNIIYTHFSPPLSELITETNVKSNNHYAEYIFKQIGGRNTTPATTEAARKNIEDFWKLRNMPVGQLFQYDGCGLASSDAVSARFFVELLTFMKNNSKYTDCFYSSLPVSGVNGTLKEFLSHSRLEGKVHAKSGTIQNVKCYAGYIEQPENTTLAFCVMVNYPNGSSKDAVKKIEDFLLDITK